MGSTHFLSGYEGNYFDVTGDFTSSATVTASVRGTVYRTVSRGVKKIKIGRGERHTKPKKRK